MKKNVIKRTKQGKSEIIRAANGCIEARRGAFSRRQTYCENQARLLWPGPKETWWWLTQKTMQLSISRLPWKSQAALEARR